MDRLTFVVLLVVLIAVVWIFISSKEKKPVELQDIGCYRGVSEFADAKLEIGKDGMLRSGSKSVPVHLRRDKKSTSFEAERRIIVRENDHRLIETRGSPDLFRINKDGSFYVPTDHQRLALFTRC